MSPETEAKLAITEVLYRYCRAVDRMDRDLADSVWHPGGTAEYGPGFQGPAATLLDGVWASHAKLTGHSHQITNVLVEVADQHAASEAYVTACLWSRFDSGELLHVVIVGRYLDRWSCRGGRWAIEHRRFVDDARFVHPPWPSAAVSPEVLSSPLGQLAASRNAVESAARRDRSDPSYDLFNP